MAEFDKVQLKKDHLLAEVPLLMKSFTYYTLKKPKKKNKKNIRCNPY
jgi:hypothetical protein